MLRKSAVLFIILLISAGISWAGGGKENISGSAEDPSGFTETIDTSDRKPGKSNYYLEATDRAGNVTIVGPENIYFDPASNLPNATIVNPVPNMRVQGNLNVVGIAFDDDGVSSIELSITRGSGGKGEEVLRVNAEGTDFWSYFLDTTDTEIWTDGNYSITAWAIDTNGLSGISADFNPKVHKKSVINWLLDRKKPETTVTSHATGALVSGNIRLRGTVKDGNGVNAFSYSVDDGKTYTPVRTSFNRATGEYNWDISINTKTIEDGPAVIWLQAVDGNSSVGRAAHLLFVNNKQPDVKIIYPAPDTIVNGIFSIAGSASHPVGVKRLSWKAGNVSSGQIELLPGNDWWTADIDLRGQKASNIDIEIRAEDVSGNVKIIKQRFKVEQNKDLPIVTLTSPVPGNVNPEEGIVVKGTASDDDGVASIFYSVNAGAAVEFPCTGNFQFLLKQIPAGTSILEVWAKDITGVIGPKTVVRGLTVPPALPQAGISSFTYPGARPAKQPVGFFTGIAVKQEPKMTINVNFRASAAPASASITFGDSQPVTLKLSSSKDLFTAAAVLPENLPEGLTLVQLRAKDRHGREIVYDDYFVISNSASRIEREEVTNGDGEVTFVEKTVAAALPFAFTFVRPVILEDNRFLFSKSDETLMGVSTNPIRSVTVSGTGSNNVSASVDGNGRVILSASQEGIFGPLTLNMVTDNGAQTSDSFRIVSDFSGPVIELRDVTENAWVRTSVPVRFSVSSGITVKTVEYSLDMGESWVSFGQISRDYSQTIELSAIEDGSAGILIRAVNESGRKTVESFTVLKDTQAPSAAVIMPIEDAGVNGTIRMAFNIEEKGSLKTIAYQKPAGQGSAAINKEIYNIDSWDKNYSARFIEVLMDSIEMPLSENMKFVFTDAAGNVSETAQWSFIIDQEMDIPIVHIILPLEEETITNDFLISGVMYDDDGVKNIQWRIDNNPWQTLEAEAGFSIPVEISSLTDNEHTITIFAEDIFGVKGEQVTRKFKVSLKEPSFTIVYPLFDTVLKTGIEVRGTASDKNGIKEVLVSLDNGNTYNNSTGSFNTAAETVQWSYKFNTTILKDGPNVMFIRVVDRYDVPATYASMINVDNTAPDIVLDSPTDGAFSVGAVSVMGRILDANLKEIDIQVRSLDGASVNEALRSRKVTPAVIIREVFNLTGQADGNYNIAVVATDLAGNVSRVSRNFQLVRQTLKNTIEIMYPLENETVAGNFNLYGQASGADKAETVSIRINGSEQGSADVDESGFFRFSFDGDAFNAGENEVIVYSDFGKTERVESRSYTIKYKTEGPWVTIDSFSFGDFAYNRPYLTGRAGYILNEEDRELLNDRSVSGKIKNEIKNKAHNFTEISFNNGRTFKKTDGGSRSYDFRYRLETGELIEGMHYIVVRSVMKNGEIAVTRMIVQVDKTHPVIRMISPEEGGIYNTSINFSATASDDIELVSLEYHLRSGDKSAYEVPGFLQGLYIEGVIPPFVSYFFDDIHPFFSGGTTFTDFGLGLSFFDDNVKVQAQYGFLTQDIYETLGGKGQLRYGGDVLGVKLLANLYSLPFGSFMGPDWEWLSASFAVGANFSYFNFLEKENPKYPGRYYTQNGKPTWLSALLLQVEFPKITTTGRSFLRTASLFTEGQLWFVPTDVDDTNSSQEIPVTMPKIVMGLRLYIF